MSKATKVAFLREYRRILQESYKWAKNETTVDSYMRMLKETIETRTTLVTVQKDGVAGDAWRAIGRKDVFSLEKVRSLPDGNQG